MLEQPADSVNVRAIPSFPQLDQQRLSRPRS